MKENKEFTEQLNFIIKHIWYKAIFYQGIDALSGTTEEIELQGETEYATRFIKKAFIICMDEMFNDPEFQAGLEKLRYVKLPDQVKAFEVTESDT